MKKSLIALAALATVATAAQAQSSVSVYGLLDAGVSSNFTANSSGQTLTAAANGILGTSRLGFRGTEDLGGGLKANFNLEGGLNPMTGAQSRSNSFFDRRAIVGLEGAWGRLDLGRNTNVGFDYAAAGITDPINLAYDGYANAIANKAAFGASQKINTVITVVSNTTLGTTRNDGTIKYTYTAKDNSYQISGAYKPGGVAGGGAEGSAYSAGARVTAAAVTGAYSHFEATDSGNRKLQYDSFGATTKVGSLKLTAGYHELKADANYGGNATTTQPYTTDNTTSAPNLTTETFAGAPGVNSTTAGKLKVTAVGVSYAVSPAYTVTVAYNEGKVSGYKNGKLENYIFQNQYALSKRTQLYGAVAYSNAKDDARALTPKSSATAVIAGVQHSF